jgi:hypothetical protein
VAFRIECLRDAEGLPVPGLKHTVAKSTAVVTAGMHIDLHLSSRLVWVLHYERAAMSDEVSGKYVIGCMCWLNGVVICGCHRDEGWGCRWGLSRVGTAAVTGQ